MPPGSNQPKNRGKVAAALKELRSCCGMTQESFAALVGAKRVTIKKIEQGQRGIGPDLANAISAATGIEGSALMIGKLQSMANRPYTPELYMRWRTMSVSDVEGGAAALLFGTFCGDLIESAMTYSGGDPSPHRFRVLMVNLGRQFRELVALVGEDRLNALLQEKRHAEEEEMTYKQWTAHFQREENPGKPKDLFSDNVARKLWQYLTEPHWRHNDPIAPDLAPNKRLMIQITTYRYWDTKNASGPSGPTGVPSLPIMHKWIMKVQSREREWSAVFSTREGFGLHCV